MGKFRKGEEKHQKNLTKTFSETIRECGFSSCFKVEPPKKFFEKYSEEDILEERKRIIEECKRILKEYEERLEEK